VAVRFFLKNNPFFRLIFVDAPLRSSHNYWQKRENLNSFARKTPSKNKIIDIEISPIFSTKYRFVSSFSLSISNPVL